MSVKNIPSLNIEYIEGNSFIDILDSPPNLKLEKYEDKNFQCIIFGRPISNDIDSKSLIKFFKHQPEKIPIKLKEINGEFLIFILNKHTFELSIINDRFCSIPIYYIVDKNKIRAAMNFIELYNCNDQAKSSSPIISKDALFEFLWFRRVHGNDTFDKNIKFLMPSSILKIKNASVSRFQYWTPSFKKEEYKSLEEVSEIFISHLTKSIKLKISMLPPGSENQIGLFLSGGMDTRTILAGFHYAGIKIPTSFTVGFSELGEFRVARKLTESLNSPHFFLKIPQDCYDSNWDEKFKLSGGMYHFLQNIFLGINHPQLDEMKYFFHGHGFDYLFQGMYLPSNPLKIFSKSTHIKPTVDLDKIIDLPDYFIKNVPYRAWRVNLLDFTVYDQKDLMLNALKSKITAIMDEIKGNSNSNFDLWEYMMINTISRHYSQTDVMGMGTHGEQIKVANDIDLFNFYLSLPLKYRKYASMMRHALNKMNPQLANTISANTNYKIKAGPVENTLYFAYRSIARKFSTNQKFLNPTHDRRTWPDEDDVVRKMPYLKSQIEGLYKCECLREHLDFFDFEAFKNKQDLWMNYGHPGGGQFMMCLLSIQRYLKAL